jgi:thiol-disulfide isomerase/thioredoxin
MFKRGLILFSLFSLLLGCSERDTDKYFYESKSYPNFTIIELEWNDLSLLEELKNHQVLASAKQQKIFIQLTGQWCSPCKRLRKKTEEAPLMNAYKGTYIIRLDYDEWKIDFPSINLKKTAVPSFIELGTDFKVTDYYIDGNYWTEITAEAMAPILKPYFRGDARPYIQNEKSKQPQLQNNN